MAGDHRRRRIGALVGLSLALAVGGGAAVAQSAGAAAVAQRQAGFKQMGAAFKAINDEIRGRSPDMAKVANAAQALRNHAAQVGGWFPRGSGAEAGVKTGARPEIWTDSAAFAAAAGKLQAETTRLQQLAAAGDAGAVRTQVRAVGAACAGCHDKFRIKD